MHVTCESFSRALSLLQGHGIEIRNETVTIVDPIRLAKHGKPDPLIDGPEGEYPSLGDHGSTGQIRLRPVLALPRPAETGQGWPLSAGQRKLARRYQPDLRIHGLSIRDLPNRDYPSGDERPRLGHADVRTIETYLRMDPSESLEAVGAVVPPELRRGRFRAPDALIASLVADAGR
jgi:hypothetical protein